MYKRGFIWVEFKFCVCKIDNCVIKQVFLIKIIVYVNLLFDEVVVFWYMYI